VASEIDNLQTFVTDPMRRIIARLATNPIASLSDTPILTELTEASFVGYAPVEITHWNPDPSSQDDLAVQVADACEFTSGALVAPQTVTMLYLTQIYNGGTESLWTCFPLDPAVTFSAPNQQISRSPRIVSMADVPV
jgi:hypothetical protein